MNKIFLTGHLGQDPEISYTPDGKSVTRFSMAVNSRNPDGSETPTWFNIIAWEKLGELCNDHLKKGRKVLIEGRLRIRSFVGKDTLKHITVDVTADQVEFLDRPPASLPPMHEETNKLKEFLTEKGAIQVPNSGVPF